MSISFFILNKNTLCYKNYGLTPFKNISVVTFGVMAIAILYRYIC